MEKQIFNEGDRVFIYGFGWVVIEKVEKFYVVIRKVYLGKDIFFYVLNELVSFTEYALQGNSQERPINYNDYVGKWGKFWDSETREVDFIVSKLDRYTEKQKYQFRTIDGRLYRHFKPLTKEQIKILELK